ncbi:MAG: DNA-directed RNA polymerase subunit alpha [Candidatus Acetothermia bacterium]
MIELIQPKDLHFETLTDTSGKLVVEPLESGMGTTLGNSLRRILLSLIPGAAVTRVKFDGKYHEYDTIDGVREDIIEIIMNFKELAIRLKREESKRLYLDAQGPGEVTAQEIEVEPGVEIINPDQPIAHLDDEAFLGVELFVEPGMGYRSAEENKVEDSPLAVIPIDADFSPVKNVNYDVETVRAGGRENCDRLVMEIETDGSIKPEEAVGNAANLFYEHHSLFRDLPQHPFGELSELEEEEEEVPEEFEKSLEDLGFNQRACNLLKEKGVDDLESLVEKSSTELLDIHGFGNKTLQKVEAKLSELGYLLADRGEDENGS